MQKIKSGDNVVVLAGKDKGRHGKVLRVLKPKLPKPGRRTSGAKVVVEGVNLVKKHTKKNSAQNKPGEIISKEAPLHISNVALLNATTNKADKVGFKVLEDGSKVRIFKSSGEVIDG